MSYVKKSRARYAVRGPLGTIQVRALPSRRVAESVRDAQYPGGRVILDPRSVAR